MKLTTKGRFAVTAMLDLAMHEALAHNEAMPAGTLPTEIKPVTLAGISERQNISLSYLEQLFSRLRRQGLVSSVRGPGGGKGSELGATPPAERAAAMASGSRNKDSWRRRRERPTICRTSSAVGGRKGSGNAPCKCCCT